MTIKAFNHISYAYESFKTRFVYRVDFNVWSIKCFGVQTITKSEQSNKQYIHVTLGQNEEQVKALDNEEAVEFKCVGCVNCWNDRRCVVKHEIKNHVVYFCLNCDDWVKVKSKVLDENWTLFDEKGNLRHDV